LLLRRPGDVRALFLSVGAWSVVLSAFAVLQFLGLVDEFEGKRPGQREPSLIGVHELGAYSAAVLTLGITSILIRDSRWTTYVVVVAGGIGVAVAAALDSVTGLIVACIALVLLTRRPGRPQASQIGVVAAIVVVVGIGAISLRSSAISAALRSIGLEQRTTTTSEHVQSYAHRTLLGYIGLRIWLDHPVLGVGWQASKEPASFGPQLAAAHRRFPHEPPRAFPAPNREWGVQNGVIQILADHGVVGLLVVGALLAAVLLAAAKAAIRSPWETAVVGLVAFAWVCVACAAITGVGIWPGFAGNTLLWLSVGLAACARKLVARPV
jgi:O-antigen ligase